MRNIESWKPSKFVFKNSRLRASADISEVAVGSRLVTSLVARAYESILPKYAKGRLLDLGCGKIPFYAAYKNYIDDNICVDWPNSLHYNSLLDKDCDLAKELPLPDNHFDSILLSDVLEHIHSPEHLWREMNRVLVAGGILMLNVPFYYRIHEEPHDYYRYTEYALRRFAENSGFRIISLEPIGGALESLTDIFAKCIAHIPFVGAQIAIFVQWLVFAFSSTRYGTKILKGSGKKFPLGYIFVAQKSSR